jgi:hypothetical protein
VVTGLFRIIGEEPHKALGDAWQIMLEARAFYERELELCRSSVERIDWLSSALASAPLNCPYCQSDLASQTDTDNSSQEAMDIVGRACGAEITAEEAVERALELCFEAESYYAVTDGGDQPLHVCPECGVEAYIFTQEEVGCAWCGEALGKCARCGVGLTPENVAFDNHSLCSYCDHVMSRED